MWPVGIKEMEEAKGFSYGAELWESNRLFPWALPLLLEKE